MKNWLINKVLKSKKFWYAVASIVIPLVVEQFGVDEVTATNIFYSFVALIIGQGIADNGIYKKKDPHY